MKRLVILFLLGIVLIRTAPGTTPPKPQDPETALQSTLEGIITVLKNDNLTVAEKEVHINKIISPVFDFELMSYLTLGKTQWTKMTPVQRHRFMELFVARLKDSYRDKFSMYSDQKIVYLPAVRKGSKVLIPTEIIDKEQAITIHYKMYEKKKVGWKIYDVEVKGVSLIKTYRSQFSEVLSKGTFEDLMQKLEKPFTEAEETPSQS